VKGQRGSGHYKEGSALPAAYKRGSEEQKAQQQRKEVKEAKIFVDCSRGEGNGGKTKEPELRKMILASQSTRLTGRCRTDESEQVLLKPIYPVKRKQKRGHIRRE